MSHQIFSRQATLSRRRAAAVVINTNSLGLGTHYDNQPSGPAGVNTPNQGALAAGSQTIDLRVKAALVTWTPAGNQFLMASWPAAATDSRFGMFVDTAGKLNGAWYRSGGVFTGTASSVALGLAANAISWVRALLNPAAGTINYFTSTDGSTWNALGTQITGLTTGSVQTPATPPSLTVGATSAATGTAIGKIYAAHLLIGGNTVAAVDFSTQTAGSTSFAGPVGETWTLSGAAAIV